ncbi:transcriptional regulator [Dactylosporangium sp. AC04546]|uniref:transcriptional regulator n=1 Tax=Dactylosporangium sp. AC04546 TaxID=2862460 RepID=UPI001EDD59DB|nr:transcriptional regulator [Dactylosporangium sp. AC04546]WVK83254.1 transcriptional regulator [Dactylosporangium sp. AC04546]
MTGPDDTPAPDGTEPPHPVTGLDDVVHQRVRLGILTLAHEARRVEFGFLRAQLELTAGNLSQHLGVLEAAGLVQVEKGYAGKRGRTWITLTAAGDAALAAEIARLKQLIARVEATTEPAATAPDRPRRPPARQAIAHP